MRGHWFCFEYCFLFEGHSEIKTLTYISGDVTSAQDVTEALQGVDTVIHTVGVISIGSLPDYVTMETVNVKGILTGDSTFD